MHFDHRPGNGSLRSQPMILRRPEVIHGLRNLIQNAVDFARETVWIESAWSGDRVTVRIMDDGPGFPGQMLGRIGDPFMRRRPAPEDPRRPDYEGMGLGLFIAKTLLERSGADLTFANGAAERGSVMPRPADAGLRRGRLADPPMLDASAPAMAGSALNHPAGSPLLTPP